MVTASDLKTTCNWCLGRLWVRICFAFVCSSATLAVFPRLDLQAWSLIGAPQQCFGCAQASAGLVPGSLRLSCLSRDRAALSLRLRMFYAWQSACVYIFSLRIDGSRGDVRNETRSFLSASISVCAIHSIFVHMCRLFSYCPDLPAEGDAELSDF